MNDITPRDQREAEKWVVRMLDEPDRHRAGLARWFLGKPGRRELYEQLLSSVEDAGQSLSVPVPETRPPFKRRRYFLPVAAALGLLLIATMTLFAWLPGRTTFAGAVETFSTRTGEVREETLADGSTLTLDTDTHVLVNLSGGKRNVTLKQGRMRLAVAPKPGQPFEVTMADSQMIAAGGVIDLSYRNRIAVNLISGSAQVRLPGWRASAGKSHQIWLRPGQMLAYSAGQSTIPAVIPSPPSDGQWTSGVKSFDDVAVREVVAEANSYSPVKIVLADPMLGDRQIFGEIRIREIDSVAEAIATFLGARIDRSQPGRLLIVK